MMASLQAASGGLWPYLVVIIIGFLPTEIWRMLAVLMARDLDENSDILLWVRLVASALLAAVVAKLVITPTGAMQIVPLWGRLGSLAVGLATLMLTKRNVIASVLAGEAVIMLSGLV